MATVVGYWGSWNSLVLLQRELLVMEFGCVFVGGRPARPLSFLSADGTVSGLQ